MESQNIIRGLPFRQYAIRALGEASSSGLKEFLRSPLRYWEWSVNPVEKDTKDRRMGRLLHAALLDDHTWQRMVPQPDFGDLRTKIGKAAKAEWDATVTPSSIVVDWEEHDTIKRMIGGMQRHPYAFALCEQARSEGNAELTLKWSQDGIMCKARLDGHLAQLALVIEAKKTKNASPEVFAQDAARYRYDIQAAWYRRACRAAKLPWENHAFICSEDEPPYDCACYNLDIDAIDAADEEITYAMKRLSRCVDANKWPGYDTAFRTLYLPKWHMDRPIQKDDE
jgi:hypothetical protein